MSQLDAVVVGNELTMPRPRLQIKPNRPKIQLVREGVEVPAITVEAIPQLEVVPVSVGNVTHVSSHDSSLWSRALDLFHNHSLIVLSLLALVVLGSGIIVAGKYLAPAQSVRPLATANASSAKSASVGLNMDIPANQFNSEITKITSQPASLTIGSNVVAISPSTIKSWLGITESSNKSSYFVHVDAQTMDQSLKSLASSYITAPVNQVSVSHNNGASYQVILPGSNGTTLADPSSLNSQVQSAAKTLLYPKGSLNFSTGLGTQPFQAVTAAAFTKLIEVNVNTDQMYLYDNGKLISTYAVTAGRADTPTPIGEFHIWEKLPLQTMTGLNPDGTTYVQPNVEWINYFDHDGDAIHGNYWRPLSVFGSVNTSHGCVGLPDNEALTVYNWAPIGTTVITHA